MINKKQGWFWHCHHDELGEYVWDYQQRVDYIKKNKPKNEIKTRLKLFRKIKGKIPEELTEAWEKFSEAWEKFREAWEKYLEAEEKCREAKEKYSEAWEKNREAREKYREAKEKYREVWEKYKPYLEKLHNEECGCREWNGEELIFVKNGK